ncbi:hypothetical protein [Pseudooceanicola marinus]|uniref:hypothetical protein n=1 Tax=Pseudooceanicola marinus TaxID=396013 RepID=UPI001CD1EA36|nr:hypothetical protein [Pseudooceanicola marinus]MCA1336857.1 hypothetical protein [Pseudooceanicola marinus]
MRWLIFSPILLAPSLSAMTAATFALTGNPALLLAAVVCSGEAVALALMTRDSAHMLRLLRAARPWAPYIMAAPAFSGWLFGRETDATNLLTMATCTGLATLALLPALCGLALSREAR